MRFIFRFFTSNKIFTTKVSELEKRISELEANLKVVKNGDHKEKADPVEKEGSPTITIQHLQIDKIVIEHLDYANNFGQLGIKELSGKLNIGTSYEGDVSKLIDDKLNEKLSNQAKVNFRAKKEPENS